MSGIAEQARAFRAERERSERFARQLAALQLGGGIDLPLALRADGAIRTKMVCRVRRIVERERLKGIAGRADYNLDRHIALSQSLAEMEERRGVGSETRAALPPPAKPHGPR